MKIVQSFWTGHKDCLKDCYGWLSPICNYLSWIVSCNQLRKYYDDVTLVTDKQGYDVLINKLQLPYTDVIVNLDELNGYNSNLWALAKIKAYDSFDEPFIHVDGDVFVWTRIDEPLKNHDLITQNQEITTDYYWNMWQFICPAIQYIPEVMQRYVNHIDSKAYNMGIFGGTDIDFIKRYARQAFDFVDRNLEDVNQLEGTNFNIFFEQVLLYQMVREESKTMSCFIREDIGDNQYHDFANFDDVPDRRSYLHLLGFYKQQQSVCKKLESFVIRNYPEYYKRLEEIFDIEERLENVGYQYTTSAAKEEEEKYIRQLVLSEDKESWPAQLHILQREIASVQKSRVLEDLLDQDENFYVLPTTNFSLQDNMIVVDGLRGDQQTFPSLKIDPVIMNVVGKGCNRYNFEQEAVEYLDESFPQSEKQNFISVLWKRVFLLVGIGILLPITQSNYNNILHQGK